MAFPLTCPGLEGSLICFIGVVDVYIKKGGYRVADSGVANHDYRAPDWLELALFQAA
jgi:hypothetical protein